MNIKKLFRKPRSWRTFIENFLSIVLIFIAFYLIFTPFLPMLTLWFNKATDKSAGFVYASNHPLAPQNIKDQSQDVNNQQPTKQEVVVKPIPQDNRLIIPNINVDISIVDGPDARSLLKGGWRRPKTSTPDKAGNTVIAGHRFIYTSTNASYFYNLDKVKVGDPIVAYWQGKEYNYVVTETKVVPATAIEIENNTSTPQLTLYTCTPLWTAKDRLVVIAKPI